MTSIVEDIRPGASGSTPQNFRVMGGHLYLRADDGVTGHELWRTDGAQPVADVTQVADINPGPEDGYPSQMTVFEGQLYFKADGAGIGDELFVSSGTGAELMADLNPGEEGSNLGGLTVFGGGIYFAADDQQHGHEVWFTDGSPPELVRDILPGSDSGDPYGFTTFGGSLYFSADDGTSGTEVWRLTDDSKVKVTIPAATIRVDRAGRARVKVRCAISEISGPCLGTVTVKTRGKVGFGGKRRQVTIGKGKFSADPGQAGTVLLKLNRKVRRLVRKTRAARKLTIQVKARDGAGNTTSVRKASRLTGAGLR